MSVHDAIIAIVACSVDPRRDVYMLAIDHRSSLERRLAALVTETVPRSLPRLKMTAVAAANDAAGRLDAGAGEVALLVDRATALATPFSDINGVDLAVAVETSGSAELCLEAPMEYLRRELVELAPRWGKILVRWNPADDPEVKNRQATTLGHFSELCAEVGVERLVEVLVPPTATDLDVTGGDRSRYEAELLPAHLGHVLHEISGVIDPDLWKIESPMDPQHALELAVAAASSRRARFVVLGAGKSYDKLEAHSEPSRAALNSSVSQWAGVSGRRNSSNWRSAPSSQTLRRLRSVRASAN